VAAVSTAAGPVELADLGRTLMHEHVFTFHSDLGADYPWKEERLYVDSAVDKLLRLKQAGISTIVDLTVPGLGRNVSRVAEVAKRASFTIIVATGLYTLSELPAYFRERLRDYGPTFLEDLFVAEITEGIGDTGIRPAVIKCCTDRQGLTPDVETVLRAAARACRRTGTPISTHTNPRFQTGLVQQRIFRQEGVDPGRVIIGHCDDGADLAYHEELLAGGSYLGMDRFEAGERVEAKVSTVAALCRRGYASRLVLSHDARCGGDIRPEQVLREWRYGFIPTTIVPALKAAGVSDHDLDLMLVKNPRAIFGAAPAERAAPAEQGDKT
jgi:phosphotriesterase-related protein